MTRILIALFAFCLAVPAVAQNGFLEGTLEEALSGEGRTVEVDGFAGALSSTATFDALRISDEEGVWLTVRQA